MPPKLSDRWRIPAWVPSIGLTGAAAAVLGVGVAEALLLSRDPRWFGTLEGWFYSPFARPIGPMSAWILLLAAASTTYVALARTRSAEGWRVTLIAMAGVAMLVGFSLIEDRGLLALRDRVLNAGHSEFARTAATGISIHDVLHRYESLISSGRFGPFERSKPPGTLLFYVLTERVGHALLPFDSENDRLSWLATFATFAWPVVSMLSLAPLFIVGRALADTERALWACALSIATPSFLLITMHADQVLFPLLVNATLACGMVAGSRNDVRLGFFAGVLGYLATFCSFGLMGAVPLFLTCVVLGAIARPTLAPSWLLAASRVFCGFAAGIAAGWATARALFGYDIQHRYEVAIRNHIAWKGWTGTAYEVTHFAWLNVFEFSIWIGAPVALLAAIGALVGLVDTARVRRPRAPLVATALVATVALLARFGRTKGESARLWLFLAQPACLAASLTLQRLFPRQSRVMLAAVWLTQFVIVLDVKRFQDFY